ncbi:glycosyltransferase family 4 protein [Marinactinospora rubrisoli]|uniref:Glycosyltransferase family 4 protein n=1 Tax=Marinactinospora rubrisoli TaxID=2715399 RepID=A0ABW2KEA4_9ACTN
MVVQRTRATAHPPTAGTRRPPRPRHDPSGPRARTGPRLDGVRVAVINWRDPWQAAAGGAEEYAWRVSRHLVACGATVTFVTSREPGQARAETRDGVRFRRMGTALTVYPLVMLWLLRSRWRFDVALDCMNGVPFFAPLVLSRRTRVISLVHHVHDAQFDAYLRRPLAWFGRFVESRVASRVYRSCPTVTVSESSRRAMRAKLRWRAPITVIHNGGWEPSPPLAPAGPPAAPGAPALVSLGRLVSQKRVARVVDAVGRLRRDWPGLRLHVVGRGPEAAALAAQVDRQDLADRVRLHGFLPEADRNAVLAAARLHVTASRFEGWGLTVIEAAAFGVPTVAYDVDGLRDSVRDGRTGWLVRDGQTLADVLHRALAELSDPARAAEISRACREWASRFTWERTGAAMAGLIAAEISPRRVRRPRLRWRTRRGAPR